MQKAQILAVDDIAANLEVLNELLSAAGYDVIAAISGERALKRLESLTPELILLDVQMPGIDGFEVCRKIKANSKTANIPVIFITALSDDASITKGFSLGAADYISKPFRELELLARVKTHLRVQSLTQDLENQVAERTAQWQAATQALQHSKLQLVQHEKMSALGNLVAGVAHEINNPISFLNGSIQNARNYVQDLQHQLDLYQKHYPNPAKPIQDYAEEVDLDFVCEDLPKLLNSMKGATDRIKSISTSLRTFSRADTEYKVSADIHEGLDSTLLILKYRLKANEARPDIEIVKNYGELPTIECFPGRLNQVFMNLLANAIDVFDETAQHSTFTELKDKPQIITVKTTALPEESMAEIRIRDNGKGISDPVKAKMFDHLFTTKAVGKGTGLGLAISQQIVVEAHGGAIDVQSELGRGTEFCIKLPY
ncbi:MAG: response regulator [Cyanobacteria bacterium P01_D01_bin.1]